MGLKRKVFFWYGGAILVLFAAFTAFQTYFVIQGFLKVEEEYADRNIFRVRDALEQSIDNINLKSADWANWDDTYRFIEDHNASYIESNLTNESLANIRINALLFYDRQSRLVTSKAVDIETAEEIKLPDSLLQFFEKNKKELLQFNAPNEFKAGLIQSADWAALISSRAIATSKQQGPIHGTIVFLKFVTPSTFKEIGALTHVQVTSLPASKISDYKLSREQETALRGKNHVLRILGQSKIEGYVLKKDLLGNPGLIMQILMPRTIFKMARSSLFYFMTGAFFLGLSLILGSLWLMNRLILKRMLNLTHQARRLAKNVRFNERMSLPGTDELAGLANSINGLLDAIEEAHKQKSDLEQRLYHSQKLEVIGRLAGGLAHDFNNLLTVIVGFAELIGETFEEQDARSNYVKEIKNYCTKAHEVIRRLLSLGKKQNLNPQIIEIHESVNKIRSIFEKFLGEHIRFIFVPCAENLYIEIDPSQFEQVLLNLINNARYEMKNGGECKITVGKAVLEAGFSNRFFKIPPGEYAEIRVADTGPGISAEGMAHLFEPYFTTKPKKDGSGLGLVTCASIIEVGKGMMDVQTKEGEGTTIIIYIPLVKNAGNNLPKTSAAPALPENKNLTHGAGTILVVEDENGILELLRKNLSGSGYKVTTAANGTEAIEIIKKSGQEFDLLISDVMMPGANGPEVAEFYRKVRPEGKVIFISGYTDEMLPSELELRKNNALFIPKPFTPSEILRAVNNVLMNKK